MESTNLPWILALTFCATLTSSFQAAAQSPGTETPTTNYTNVVSAHADEVGFTTLYTFEVPAANTFTSPLGSQPDTRPVLGPDGAVYGMTIDGGQFGNGVIYRFDLDSRQYTVLHTFSAMNANGDNEDGASPGVALTADPSGVFYGMASLGGANGSGTIFKITTSGEFTVLYSFSALDANGNNPDGATPYRTIVIGNDGNLYGTTSGAGQTLASSRMVAGSRG